MSKQYDNPLMDSIETILDSLGDEPVSITSLVAKLRELGALSRETVGIGIDLFQLNFQMMNALYEIQVDWGNRQYRALSISPLEILSRPWQISESTVLRDFGEMALKEYYLDPSNLTEVTEASVHQLLDTFWSRFVCDPEVEAALTLLGVDQDCSFSDIKQAYRKKMMVCHPDRGGSHDEVARVNRAYEILSAHFR